jgi:hypothetical protein
MKPATKKRERRVNVNVVVGFADVHTYITFNTIIVCNVTFAPPFPDHISAIPFSSLRRCALHSSAAYQANIHHSSTTFLAFQCFIFPLHTLIEPALSIFPMSRCVPIYIIGSSASFALISCDLMH